MSIASSSTIVKFHEFPSGNVLHNYQPGTQINGPIRSISWSKDGNWLALVPYSGLTEIISIKDQLKLIHTVQGIEEPSCASFQNSTKKNIAVGTNNGQVLVYDIKSRNVKKRFPRAISAVSFVEYTYKDSHVIAACENGEAYLYSNVQNNLSGTFKIPRSQSISALRTNPIKRNFVVAGSNEGVVVVWDIHGNQNKFFIGSHKAPVTSVVFSPNNPDLVVSAGLDRQFCLYDVSANKCIGNIFVENSMSAIDFSPDGKFLIMASQKGAICIYDVKNLQKPVQTFIGHNSPVEHLAFRKNEDYESSFILSSENLKDSLTSEKLKDQSNDSFSVGLVSTEGTSVKSQNLFPEDSFLAAMGMDQNNTKESNKDSFKLNDQSKKYLIPKYTPTNPSKILQEKFFDEIKTSTPDCVNYELYSNISPVINLEQAVEKDEEETKTNLQDLREFIKTAVRDEIKIVSEELKSEMKYQTAHILSQTRQFYLSLIMSNVKESIRVGNQLSSIQSKLIFEVPQSQSALIEENLSLRQKLAMLEEENLLLKNNQLNQHT